VLLSIYPNGEIRARVPGARPSAGRSRSSPLILVNQLKVAISALPPVEACRYPSCPWPRPGYGGTPSPTTFSVYGRRMLARAGGIFSPAEEKRLCFLTGTLPGSTSAAMKAMSDYSSWIVHEVLTRLPRVIGVPASELRYEWVWELQRRGALHWHGVIECPTEESAQALLLAFRGVWISVLLGLKKKSSVDIFERWYGGTWADKPETWRIDAQLAKASPQQYLSKYLSKENGKVGSLTAYYPVRWYGCSRLILKDLRSRTVVRSTSLEQDVPAWLLTDSDVELLAWIDSLSVKTIPLRDPYSSGKTIVFYLKQGDDRLVASYVKGYRTMQEYLAQIWREGRKNREKRYGGIEFSLIEKCSKKSFLMERLMNDVGERQRLILEEYLVGGSYAREELLLIDSYAAVILCNAGCFAPVNSEAPPERGVDSVAPKQAGNREGCQVEIEYPGLPF
jgi:hypothetical protein